jgi:DNA processing protein
MPDGLPYGYRECVVEVDVMYSDQSRLWLELLSVEGIGANRWLRVSRTIPLRRIVEMLGSAGGRRRLGELLGRRVAEPDRGFFERQLMLLSERNSSLVSIADRAYPSLLREIADPPPLLFYRGELAVCEKPSITIVGSRTATRRGLLAADHFAYELSRRDIVVVSGLARGIDGAAHGGALKGRGGTCAVLGCGVDVVYPPEHVSLAAEIAERGCLVSELPLGTPPLRRHFPRRNRILSGLSLGVLIVEAGVRSGAMGTARWAVEQNREVFAVPGPITHPGSRGPHRLIREGASLVERVEDILGELPPCGTVVTENAPGLWGVSPPSLSERERRVLAALELDPKHIDDLVQICHISAASMLPILLDLEMKGLAASTGGGCYALAANLGGDSTGGT